MTKIPFTNKKTESKAQDWKLEDKITEEGRVLGVINIIDIKEFLRRLKEDWREKTKRMEIMSGDVAFLELKWLIDKLAGKSLVESK